RAAVRPRGSRPRWSSHACGVRPRTTMHVPRTEARAVTARAPAYVTLLTHEVAAGDDRVQVVRRCMHVDEVRAGRAEYRCHRGGCRRGARRRDVEHGVRGRIADDRPACRARTRMDVPRMFLAGRG